MTKIDSRPESSSRCEVAEAAAVQGGFASSHGSPDGEEEDVEVVVVDDDKPGECAESGPTRLPSSYRLGRSCVTEETLDRFVEDGLLSLDVRLGCRAPRQEEISAPEAYEAVIFRDFLTVGLRFPCERFVCEVLERFNLQIHQLTPNAFSCLGVFAMALKIIGSELEVNTFTKYYESRFREKVVMDRSSKTEWRVEFGSYNFVPQKSQGTVSIVPSYRNKWPGWIDHWFYVGVCTDEEDAVMIENGMPKASVVVLQMTLMGGVRLADCFVDGASDVSTSERFYHVMNADQS